MQLELIKILDKNSIININVDSKKNLFHEISSHAGLIYGLDNREVFSALLERESLGPTGMGEGIAIPHARVSKVDSVKGIFIRLEKPIWFDAIDGIPVDLIFGDWRRLRLQLQLLHSVLYAAQPARSASIAALERIKEEADNGPVSTSAVTWNRSQSDKIFLSA